MTTTRGPRNDKVENLTVFLEYHPRRFSIPGNGRSSHRFDIEVAVARYRTDKHGHKLDQAYSAQVMDVESDDDWGHLKSREKTQCRQTLIEAIAQRLGIDERHVTYPREAENPPLTTFRATSRRASIAAVPCPRSACRGTMLPDDDGDRRCLLCGRYEEPVAA